MSEHIRNFIDAISDGDNINAKSEFDMAMASKLSSSFDSKRQEVAKTFVSQTAQEEEPNNA